MYIISNVSCRDFMSFETLDYDIKKNVTTMVFGQNNDSENSQPNNGSGKSSLLEVISFGIIGVPLRKVVLNDLINDSSDNAWTKIRLENKILDKCIEITRSLSRKEGQLVSVDTYVLSTGAVTERPDTSSKIDTDNWIFEEIGVAKGDFHNNFILSSKRFNSFLSLNDKDMKAVINNFSKGNIVDVAIEKIDLESQPVKESLDKVSSKIDVLRGSIDVLREQADNSTKDKEARREAINRQISKNKESISSTRKESRETFNEIANLKEKKGVVESQLFDFTEIIELNKDNFQSNNIDIIHNFCKSCNISGLDIKTKFLKISSSVPESEKQIVALNSDIAVIKKEFLKRSEELLAIKSELANTSFDHSSIIGGIDAIETDLQNKRLKIRQITDEENIITSSLSKLKNKLSGSIVCPKCDHKFLIADEEFDIDAGEGEAVELSKKLDNLCLSKGFVIEDGLEAKELLKTQELKEASVCKKIASIESAILKEERFIESVPSKEDLISSKISAAKQKIDNVGDAVDTLINKVIEDITYRLENSILKASNEIDLLKQKRKAYDSSISTTESIIADLESVDIDDTYKSIVEKIGGLEIELSTFIAKQAVINDEFNKLREQRNIFIEYKSFLARSKIEDLNSATNYYLEKFGADLRVNITGFTKQKNGKIKDKISIKMLRGGIDAGSFQKFSDGEQARVLISNILAMIDLVNFNCDAGKGLYTLCLDEIMNAVDFGGNKFILNVLNELGITCLMVSHGLIPEGYDDITVVEKDNGVSTIKK